MKTFIVAADRSTCCSAETAE